MFFLDSYKLTTNLRSAYTFITTWVSLGQVYKRGLELNGACLKDMYTEKLKNLLKREGRRPAKSPHFPL